MFEGNGVGLLPQRSPPRHFAGLRDPRLVAQVSARGDRLEARLSQAARTAAAWSKPCSSSAPGARLEATGRVVTMHSSAPDRCFVPHAPCGSDAGGRWGSRSDVGRVAATKSKRSVPSMACTSRPNAAHRKAIARRWRGDGQGRGAGIAAWTCACGQACLIARAIAPLRYPFQDARTLAFGQQLERPSTRSRYRVAAPAPRA